MAGLFSKRRTQRRQQVSLRPLREEGFPARLGLLKPERCSWNEERDRPGRTSRRLADWSPANPALTKRCVLFARGVFRRDAENSGRDATRSQTNCIVPVKNRATSSNVVRPMVPLWVRLPSLTVHGHPCRVGAVSAVLERAARMPPEPSGWACPAPESARSIHGGNSQMRPINSVGRQPAGRLAAD